MDPRTTPGFLGTNASLAADITLLVYVFLIVPAMIAGFVFARRKMFVPHHKYIMTGIVLLNWGIILYLMINSYSRAVAPGVPDRLGESPFLLPSVHLVFGAIGQILGTILVLRMWLEMRLPRFLVFEPIKPWMRLTLASWLIAALLGIGTYLTWYGFPFTARAATEAEPTPVSTEEATQPPASTEEATQPAPATTEEATQPPPASTEEATQPAPAATEEATQPPPASSGTAIESGVWRQVPIENAPLPRYGYVLIYATDFDRFVLFGGRGPEGNLNDLWTYVP